VIAAHRAQDLADRNEREEARESNPEPGACGIAGNQRRALRGVGFIDCPPRLRENVATDTGQRDAVLRSNE